ncbi:MAG: glycosyltransferase family 4 protein [Patescibacteria group bacterium]|nr:glycosyltransferase family 4 protein [Patescibacteria group bacterium]MCL5431700.1 glycosyltransferase family 4 protein [Patescibacteria group bacterium]
MQIGINGFEANVAHRVGAGQYAYELLRHLPRSRVYLPSAPLADMPAMDYKIVPGNKLWTLTSLQKQLLLDRDLDVFFTPGHYAPLFVPVPSVIAIMDLAFEKFPQFFKKSDLYQLKYWTRYCAGQAKKILTISESTKKDICEIYGQPSDKVVVAYPGYDKKRFNSKVKPSKKYGDYLLFLGTLQPRKNIERLIEAFYQLPGSSLKLVIVGMRDEGRGGWLNDKIRASDRVILTGYLPDDQLPGLYAGAKAYVLPSLYEGFGIPVLEAMACGTPVLVSRVSSLPEACEEAAIYIEDPYRVDSIRAGLEEVLAVGDKKVKLGLEQVKRYNWEDTAKKTLEVLYEVAKK